MRHKYKYIAVVLLLAAGAFFVHTPRQLLEPQAKELGMFPAAFGEWHLKNTVFFDRDTLQLLRPSDYLMRTYGNRTGASIGLYVGYHNGGKDSGPIHSPKNCLPSSGWLMGESKPMTMQAGKTAVHMVRASFSKGPQNMTCYYWYQVRERILTGDLEMRLATLAGMLFSRRRDASFIRLDVFAPPSEKTDQLMRDFVEEAYPRLLSHLPS